MLRRSRPTPALAKMMSGLALALFPAPPTSAAEDLEAITAEALFRDGKALLERRDYARACPLLSASAKLDPATGALLALAICHEGEGKLASAALEYERVATRAAAEHRPDRVQVAQSRIASIKPLLSTLTVVPPSDASRLEGLSVLRNGTALEVGSWGVPIPSDGGDYSIEVSAAHRTPWRAMVSVKASGDARVVAVPVLAEVVSTGADTAAPARHASAAPQAILASVSSPTLPSEAPGLVKPATPTNDPVTPARSSALRVSGLALMGGGIVALAAGAVYGLRAIGKNQDSRSACDGNACSPAGRRDRLEALSAGDKATFAFLAGGIAAAAGVTLFAIGNRHTPATATAPTHEAITAGIGIGPGGAELLVRLTLDP